MPARVRCARSWYRVLTRGRGSAGRASPCQGEGRGFESRRPLHSEDPLNEGVFVVFRASPPEFEVVLLLSAAGVHGEHSTIGISCVAVRAIALTVRWLWPERLLAFANLFFRISELECVCPPRATLRRIAPATCVVGCLLRRWQRFDVAARDPDRHRSCYRQSERFWTPTAIVSSSLMMFDASVINDDEFTFFQTAAYRR